MPLTLQVRDADHLLPTQDVTRVLEVGTLTIGRGMENDWVLPDPERVISKQHCEIRAEDGQYRLTDTSSNGVFHNATDAPIGRGSSVTLKSGDTFRISHFEIEVVVTEEDSLITGQAHDPSELFGEDETLIAADSGELPDIFSDKDPAGGEPLGESASFFDEAPSPAPADEPTGDESLARILGESNESDPFGETSPQDAPAVLPDGDFGLGGDFRDSPVEDPATALEHAPTGQDFLQMPEAAPAIPDDWDDEWTGSETTPETKAPASSPIPPDDDDPFGGPGQSDAGLSAEPAIPAEPLDRPPPQAPADPAPAQLAAHQPTPAPTPATQAPDLSQAAALKRFLSGAGLEDLDIPEAQAAETLEMLGKVYRTVIQGLMEVLAARSSIKNEFRLSQTMIQPVENNPLKFSLGVDDAMIALLTKKSRGYMPPMDAVEESFEDIKAHQIAVLAGMQVALTGLLARFDPKVLEERIEEDKGIAKLLTGKKSRYWDEFNKLYKQLVEEAEDDFQSVFGREFGRAYEEQVRKQGR